MSDALTDISRDQRRIESFENYLLVLLDYLKNPININLKRIIQAAQEVDNIGNGYWGVKTNLSKNLKKRLKLLLAHDEKEWLVLLNSIDSNSLRKQFKNLSPFKNKIIINVSYNYGFGTVNFQSNDIVEFLNIIGDKDDKNEYFIIIPKSGFKSRKIMKVKK